MLGHDAIIKNGVSIWDGVTIEDRVFVGPNVAFTNDLVPRAKARREVWDPTLIREGASLGANATIVCGTTIGRYALVGAGAVVTKDVPDFGLVVGTPGRLVGFVCHCGQNSYSRTIGLSAPVADVFGALTNASRSRRERPLRGSALPAGRDPI